MQFELAQAKKLESIGHLAAGIAHEINTPAQYVGDNIRFLKDAFADMDTLLGRFDCLLEAAKQDTLTDELLAEVEAAVHEAGVDFLSGEAPRARTIIDVESVAMMDGIFGCDGQCGVESRVLISDEARGPSGPR